MDQFFATDPHVFTGPLVYTAFGASLSDYAESFPVEGSVGVVSNHFTLEFVGLFDVRNLMGQLIPTKDWDTMTPGNRPLPAVPEANPF